MELGHTEARKPCMARMTQKGRMLRYAYDYKVVRGVIGGARSCLAMKHHPIVFAMANAVPTVSVAVDNYYKHKNRGALALFGMEAWVLDEGVVFDARGMKMVMRLLEQRAEISAEIGGQLATYAQQDGDAIRDIVRAWHEGSGC